MENKIFTEKIGHWCRQKMPCPPPQISQRKLSRTATKPQNSREFYIVMSLIIQTNLNNFIFWHSNSMEYIRIIGSNNWMVQMIRITTVPQKFPAIWYLVTV